MSDFRRRIGLTMRTVQADGYDEPRDALAQLWPKFMTAALPDADWMYIPSLGADTPAFCDRWKINGLILTGGEDIGSSSLRDRSEHALLDWARRKKYPLLGICRGMQLMAFADGAELETISNHVAVRHSMYGEYSWEVNSYHSIRLNVAPQGYRTLSKAPDNSVEAIRHEDLPWEGWMWHPEREITFSDNDIREIKRIFQ